MQQLTLLPVYRQADLISLVASKPKVMATLSYASPVIYQCIREIARAPRQVILQCKPLSLGSIFVKVASYTSAQSVNVMQCSGGEYTLSKLQIVASVKQHYQDAI